jgi:hypothetical protein
MVKYSFPNLFIGLGSDNEYVKDLQRKLGILETGVFDFLTMAHVVVHKFRNGLNHEEPIVDRETWDSIMGVDSSQADVNTPDIEPRRTPNVDTVNEHDTNFDRGGVSAPNTGAIADRSADVPAQNTVATAQGDDNAPTTVTGVTTATPENTPEVARPDTNPDSPRTDQPTITAQDQANQNQPVVNNPLPNAVETPAQENAPEQTPEEPTTPATTTEESNTPPSPAPDTGETGRETTAPTP